MKYSNYDDDDNDNDRGLSLPVIYTMIAMAGIVLIVILVVVSQNTRSSNRKTAAEHPDTGCRGSGFRDGESGEAGENTGLRSEDLDFWNMYGDRNAGEVVEESPTPSPSPSERAFPIADTDRGSGL